MKRERMGGMLLVALLAAGAVAGRGLLGAQPPRQQPFVSSVVTPPPGWKSTVFQLSQNYPAARPVESAPWRSIDFRSRPAAYLQSVFTYCREGNTGTSDWDGAHNPIRHWYHAPWMHTQPLGREPLHGLTYEREFRAHDLGPDQNSKLQNWAVALYNPLGGWTLGRVWKNHGAPDLNQMDFPEDTVGVKLLFTQATAADLPSLKGAKRWSAYIYDQLLPYPEPNATDSLQLPRSAQSLSLLQIDIAVRDNNSPTGWVLGTFCYDGDQPGKTVWDRMVPVGLMWGNDPGITAFASPPNATTATDPNKLQNALLKETWINPQALTLVRHLGWNGRLVGPVDNPLSSCLSCHSTAQVGTAASTTPPPVKPGSPPPDITPWFRDLKLHQPFTPGDYTCEDSLQLATGLKNFYADLNQPEPVHANAEPGKGNPGSKR